MYYRVLRLKIVETHETQYNGVNVKLFEPLFQMNKYVNMYALFFRRIEYSLKIYIYIYIYIFICYYIYYKYI